MITTLQRTVDQFSEIIEQEREEWEGLITTLKEKDKELEKYVLIEH